MITLGHEGKMSLNIIDKMKNAAPTERKAIIT